MMMKEHYTQQPKRDDCIKLLKQHGTPDNIIRHSLKVNQVAVFLGQKLVEKQELIDLQVLDRASLLHDICKHQDPSDGHCSKGAEILLKMGNPDTAAAISHHQLNFILKYKFNNWEELLVYYADKRVDGEYIVSVDERLDNLKARFPDEAEEIESVRPLLKALEAQIFKHFAYGPEDLSEKIRNFTGAQIQSGCM